MSVKPKKLMKRSIASTVALMMLFSVLALAPSACVSARVGVGFGIRVNVPPPPLRAEVVVVQPGPGYVWVPGYWDWDAPRGEYLWIAGAWTRPPHRHAVWVGPRWERRGRESFFLRGHWRR